MKINNGYNANAAQAAERAQEAAAAAQGKAAKGAGKAGGGDEVNLSSLASAVQSALSDSPERTARLEQLAADYAAGNYQPDAAATARGLIDDSLSTEEEKPK